MEKENVKQDEGRPRIQGEELSRPQSNEEKKQTEQTEQTKETKETKDQNIKEGLQELRNDLTQFQSQMLTTYFKEHFAGVKGLFGEPENRNKTIQRISKELSIPVLTLNQLYTKAKDNYYTSIKRLPAEAIINQLNAEGQALKEEIYNTSTKDIVDKAKAITTVNEQLARVNKLYDVSPVTNIIFTQNLNPEDLLNPSNFQNYQGEQNED